MRNILITNRTAIEQLIELLMYMYNVKTFQRINRLSSVFVPNFVDYTVNCGSEEKIGVCYGYSSIIENVYM